MHWPHQDEFPARGKIVAVGCFLSAVLGASMPDISVAQRFAAILLVPFALGTTYFFFRLFLRVLGVFSRHLAVAYAFFAFYGMLLAAAVFVVLFPVIVFDPEITDPVERAYMAATTLPAVAGVCAAVTVTLRRWRDGLA